MKIFLILTLSLCAVQCSDILVKVIQEAFIGNCKGGCNRCPTTGGNKTLSYYEAQLETAKQEEKALEQEVEKASSAETSIYNAGNATQDLVEAVSGNNTRRHRRKRASEDVSLTSCDDPSTTINGTVTETIILVLQGIKSSLQALSVDNLDTTTLDCYITLARSLQTRLNSGLLVKPTNITVITTVAVSVQTSVGTTIVVVIVYKEEKETALATKQEEVAQAKADVITAGGTVVATTTTTKTASIAEDTTLLSTSSGTLTEAVSTTSSSTAVPSTTTTVTANSFSSVSTADDTSIASNTSGPAVARLYCDADCGSSVITVPRIVGGQQATPYEYPWQVLLEILADGFTSPAKCGASIIKKSWLLTAAHCVVDPSTFDLYSNLNIRATLAEHDINNETETESFTIFPSFVFVHPQYKKGPDAELSEEHDIALLYLDGNLNFGYGLRPLCMPQPGDYVAEKEVIATGWGLTTYNGDSPNTLQEVSLTLKSQSDCNTLNENAPDTYIVTDNMICALGQNKDACQGDSGGPLITKSEDGRWIQLGIVSFGYKCAEPNVPGFYTNLVNYVDWITNVTQSTDC